MVVDRRYMVQDMARNVSRKLQYVHIKLVAYKLPVFENMHDVCSMDSVVVTHKTRQSYCKSSMLVSRHVHGKLSGSLDRWHPN